MLIMSNGHINKKKVYIDKEGFWYLTGKEHTALAIVALRHGQCHR